jgi:hypothetical protein
MLLFADDQVIISNAVDNLQKAVYTLNQIITEHGLTISVQKAKLMVFKGQDPFRSKIAINYKIIEVNSFNNFGSLVSYEKEVDIDYKLNNYLNITGIINNIFRAQKVLKKTRIKYTLCLSFELCYTVVKIGPLKQET